MLLADDGHMYVCFKQADANVTRIQIDVVHIVLILWYIIGFVGR